MFAALCLLALVLGCALAVLFRWQLRTLEEKRRSDSRYRIVVEQAGDGILLVDAATGRLTEANYSLRHRLGYSADEIVGLKLEDILVEPLSDPDLEAFDRITNTRSRPRSLKQRCKSGELLDVEVTASHLDIDDRRMICYIAHDVTERKRIELELLRHQRHLDYLAHHDSLTGLPNRLFLRTYLEQALPTCGTDRGLAVLLLDLDNFKSINDSYGHNVGDELLVEVARQLEKFVGSRGIVARLGGDEFVIVFDDVAAREDAALGADAVLRVLTGALRVAGRGISTSVSIGVTLYPEDAHDLESVLRNADLAMYRAKEAGRNNVRFFQSELKRQVRRRLTIEQALRDALETQQLVVHYHPQISVSTPRIVALEARVRWAHPQLGLVPLSKFIPIAEGSGLIVPIGEHVLRMVCEQVVRWQVVGVPTVPVALNWSAIPLQHQSVVDVVHRILRDTRMQPHLPSLEITEGALMRDLRQHAAALQTLRNSKMDRGFPSFADTLAIRLRGASHLGTPAADIRGLANGLIVADRLFLCSPSTTMSCAGVEVAPKALEVSSA